VAELLPGWPNRRRRGRAAGLIEILNTADQFCAGVESALQDAAPLSARDDQELRTKLGLCRNLMAYVRRLPNPGIDNPAARDGVKSLITAMLWVAYYARTSLKYKTVPQISYRRSHIHSHFDGGNSELSTEWQRITSKSIR